MKRVITTCAIAATLAGAAAAFALASANPALNLRITSKGKIVVNFRGFTVYAFTADKQNVDNCVKKPVCLTYWPIVRPGAPLAGAGLKHSLIGTITVKGHGQQLTYSGHPLYTYTQDTKPGETKYVNILQFGGFWPAVNAGGQEVK